MRPRLGKKFGILKYARKDSILGEGFWSWSWKWGLDFLWIQREVHELGNGQFTILWLGSADGREGLKGSIRNWMIGWMGILRVVRFLALLLGSRNGSIPYTWHVFYIRSWPLESSLKDRCHDRQTDAFGFHCNLQ